MRRAPSSNSSRERSGCCRRGSLSGSPPVFHRHTWARFQRFDRTRKVNRKERRAYHHGRPCVVLRETILGFLDLQAWNGMRAKSRFIGFDFRSGARWRQTDPLSIDPNHEIFPRSVLASCSARETAFGRSFVKRARYVIDDPFASFYRRCHNSVRSFRSPPSPPFPLNSLEPCRTEAEPTARETTTTPPAAPTRAAGAATTVRSLCFVFDACRFLPPPCS
jgi:hypothetical protein